LIKVTNEIKRVQKNFWNNCLFHPTDAVEDPWGKKILDRMARDKAIKTIRIYAMFEDIVYLNENENLAYDFRLNDLRLDYLCEKGYDILIAYGMMPECIATNKNATSNVSKNKTRYKGKMINTSQPVDYKLWEEICYTYTKHIIDRYGIEKVSKWHLQCFNEPDHPQFFMSHLSVDKTDTRIKEYCKLYTAFTKGIERASDKMCFGGPALAHKRDFLAAFLDYVRKNSIRLDFISLHNYAGMNIERLNDKTQKFSVSHWLRVQKEYTDLIANHGFADTELIVDEWGMAAWGFYNVEECPAFMTRETEVYASYYVKMISEIIKREWKLAKLMICLSGQHEMVTDFSGFRNFFTLNFFAKPIYNAYVLAGKLHKNLLRAETDNENLYVIPTKSTEGNYSVLLTYSSEFFEEDIPNISEELVFEKDIKDKFVRIYCIDKQTTNPYRLYERMGKPEILKKEINELRNEGNIKPVSEYTANENNKIKLNLTPNSVYLVEVI